MIAPTVGRVVLFRFNAKEDALAAIIAKVLSDREVNLMVISENGVSMPFSHIPLVQDGEKPPADGHYCEWMAYQKGQAAKTEALEAKLGAAS